MEASAPVTSTVTSKETPTKQSSLSGAAAYAPKKRFKHRFEIPTNQEDSNVKKEEKYEKDSAAVEPATTIPGSQSHGNKQKVAQIPVNNSSLDPNTGETICSFFLNCFI